MILTLVAVVVFSRFFKVFETPFLWLSFAWPGLDLRVRHLCIIRGSTIYFSPLCHCNIKRILIYPTLSLYQKGVVFLHGKLFLKFSDLISTIFT